MRRHIQLLCVVLCTLTSAYAQVDNIKLAPAGDKYVITYDLTSSDPSQKFKITAFSGHDNFTSALQHVSGAVGENVAPGKGLTIEWDHKSSLPANFNGILAIRLRAVGMLQVKPLDKSVFKKGSELLLNWSGGAKGNKVNIELLRKDNVYKMVATEVDNTNTFTWKIPKNLKGGKEYSIRLNNVTEPMQPTSTSQFEIKPKIPKAVKIAAAAVIVAGGIIIMTLPKDDDELPGIDIKPN